MYFYCKDDTKEEARQDYHFSLSGLSISVTFLKIMFD